MRGLKQFKPPGHSREMLGEAGSPQGIAIGPLSVPGGLRANNPAETSGPRNPRYGKKTADVYVGRLSRKDILRRLLAGIDLYSS